MLQVCIIRVLMVTVVLGLAAAGFAQEPARLPDPEVKTVTTDDDFPIKITYYGSGKGKESPVVILLHGKDGNRFIWQNDGGFAQMLQKDGYAVVTVDLRHHGESRASTVASGAKPPAVTLKPADYLAMIKADLPAVKRFLMQEHHDQKLNINKLALVGPGMGGAVAAYFAGDDWLAKPYPDAPLLANRTPRGQDVRGLVLISPDTKLPKLPITTVTSELCKPAYNTAFLVCHSRLPADKNEATTIFKQLTTFSESAKRMYKQDYNTKLTGTEMLGKGLDLEKHVLVFLNKHVKGADSQWRNRKSELAAAQ